MTTSFIINDGLPITTTKYYITLKLVSLQVIEKCVHAVFTRYIEKLTSGLILLIILVISSSENKSGISPHARKSLIGIKNFSSNIWASVIKKTELIAFKPVFKYRLTNTFCRKEKYSLKWSLYLLKWKIKYLSRAIAVNFWATKNGNRLAA